MEYEPDTVALVGNPQGVADALNGIRDRIADVGLAIHPDDSPKSLTLSATEWLVGRNDFGDSRREISWTTLIGDLKRFLLANPESDHKLRCAFLNAGVRMPVLDYSTAIFERSFLENFGRWARRRWFREKVRAVSIDSLLGQALSLRASYDKEFSELIHDFENQTPYERKRRIPKLRYRAGRLSYLADENRLTVLSDQAVAIRELHVQSTVLAAVSSGHVDGVLKLGTNAAQAAAQSMRASNKAALFATSDLSNAEIQALAVFLLNGVQVRHIHGTFDCQSELLAFAKNGATLALMKSDDRFMAEFACLHGIGAAPRHAAILETVFDEDEELAIDAVEQLGQSLSQ